MELSSNSIEKKNEMSEPVEEEVDIQLYMQGPHADSDAENPETHSARLKQMHEDIKKIRQNAKISKAKCQTLRQKAENCDEGLKNEEKQDDKSIINDLCEISMNNSSSIWNEIKKTEDQVRILKDKICSSGEILAFQRKKNSEIKAIMREIESTKNLSSAKPKCGVCNIH